MEQNTQTLAQFIAEHAPGHRFGTKALHELVEGIKRTGKGGSVSFTIKLVPDPKRSHALLVSDAVVAKVPQLDPPQRLTWLTPSGEIISHDPNQLPLPIDDPAAVRTSVTTIETGGGIFTGEAPDDADDDVPAHSEEQAARVLQFAEAAFAQTPPPGAIDDDGEVSEGVVQQLVDGGLVEVVEPAPGDDLPMQDDVAGQDDEPGSVKPDDFETTTGAALAEAAAAAAAPDNVTEIKTRAPRKSRAKVSASAT